MTRRDHARFVRRLETVDRQVFTTTERVILADLALAIDNPDYPSGVDAHTLARRWGLSLRTVQNVLSGLARDDLIRRVGPGRYVMHVVTR